MNGIHPANRRQRASERRSFHGAFLLAAGIGSLSLMTVHQAAADEVALDQAIFHSNSVEQLDDTRLAEIRGKFVDGELETTDDVILWDERPGSSGQGGRGAGDQSGNSVQGIGNQQATRVTTHRSQ